MQNVKNHSECNTGECYNMIKGREEHKRRDREYGNKNEKKKERRNKGNKMDGFTVLVQYW